MWVENNFFSYVTLSVVSVPVWGLGILLSINACCRLYSSAFGVIRVSVVFEEETLILFE